MTETTTTKTGDGAAGPRKESLAASQDFEKVIIRGEAEEIDLPNIEKGITALWQAATKVKEGEEAAQSPVMRACVLNLVIFTDNEKGLEKATEVVARLTWSYPCRAIVLVAYPDRPSESLRAFISAHCQLPDPKGNKACCEQITVEGSAQATERLASMVLPLLVPDLPVVMWWPGDPPLEGPLFDRIMQTSDRLIIDSRRFKDPVSSFKRLAQLSEMKYQGVAFNDLNWSRLTPWRRLIAQFFDSPNTLPYLNHFQKIELEYESPGPDEIANFSEALLLLGWLGNQLGWKPAFSLLKGNNNASLIINENGRPLNIGLQGHNLRMDEAGGITSIQFHSSIPGENRPATFKISMMEDFKHAEVTIQEADKPARVRTVQLADRDDAELLGEDLAIIKHDLTYEAALALAGQLASQV